MSVIIILHILLMATATFLLFRLYRFLIFKTDVFGKTPQYRFLCLLITCGIFPGFFYFLFAGPCYFVFQSTADTINAISNVGASKFGFADYTSILEKQSASMFGKLAFNSLVYAIVFSLLLAIGLAKLFYDQESQKYQTSHLAPTVKKAIVMITTMAIGLYLALSSIFSLSYINDSSASRVPVITGFDSTLSAFQKDRLLLKQANLLQQMDSVYNTTEITIRQFEQDGNDSLESIKTKQLMQPWKPLKDEFDSVVGKISERMDWLQNQKKEMKALYNGYRIEWEGGLNKAKLKFRSGSAGLSAGVLQKYSDDWIIYLSQIQAGLNDFVDINYSNYISNVTRIQSIPNGFMNYLSFLVKNNDWEDSLQTLRIRATLPLLPDQNRFFVESSIVMSMQQLPNPGDTGEDWGSVFSFFIKWAAKSMNIDILMIIGMIGFGLFGAAISKFVSGSNPAKDGLYIVEDSLQVLVRGLSAAIVVFLAMRGGIAVLNNGNSNPNPLILFLFCFIGAVFSERIWVWAKGLLATKFPEDQEKNKGDKNDLNLAVLEKKDEKPQELNRE